MSLPTQITRKLFYVVYMYIHVTMCNFLHRLSLSDCEVIGSMRVVAVDLHVRQCLLRQFSVRCQRASAFYRATIAGRTYYSRLYDRIKRRNSYTVCYVEGGKHLFGFIDYFLSLSSSSFAVVTPLTPNSSHCYPHQLSVLHQCIIPVSVESSVVCVPTKCILYKCVCVEFGSVCFIAKLPNQLYGD